MPYRHFLLHSSFLHAPCHCDVSQDLLECFGPLESFNSFWDEHHNQSAGVISAHYTSREAAAFAMQSLNMLGDEGNSIRLYQDPLDKEGPIWVAKRRQAALDAEAAERERVRIENAKERERQRERERERERDRQLERERRDRDRGRERERERVSLIEREKEKEAKEERVTERRGEKEAHKLGFNSNDDEMEICSPERTEVLVSAEYVRLLKDTRKHPAQAVEKKVRMPTFPVLI